MALPYIIWQYGKPHAPHTSSLSCHPFSLSYAHNTSKPVCATIRCKDSGLFMKSSDTFSAKTSCWKRSRRREENRHVCKLLEFLWTDQPQTVPHKRTTAPKVRCVDLFLTRGQLLLRSDVWIWEQVAFTSWL